MGTKAKFNVGDKVEKVGSDYTFVGIVVAAFQKLSGVDRYVVEMTAAYCMYILKRI